MKRLLAVTLIMLFALSSCGQKKEECSTEQTEQRLEVYGTPTALEKTEFEILVNSGVDFLRRSNMQTHIEYEVVGDLNAEEVNILSTNLYLMWHDEGLDPKIIIMGIDADNRELVRWMSTNGKLEVYDDEP